MDYRGPRGGPLEADFHEGPRRTQIIMSDVKVPMIGIGANGKDPVLEKLDLLIEEQQEVKELLEEVVERLSELDLPYNSVSGGFN